MFIVQLIDQNPLAFFATLAFVTILKGIALWRAAQLNQRNWFIALLIVNTLGILEIIYLLFVSKKYSVEVKQQ